MKSNVNTSHLEGSKILTALIFIYDSMNPGGILYDGVYGEKVGPRGGASPYKHLLSTPHPPFPLTRDYERMTCFSLFLFRVWVPSFIPQFLLRHWCAFYGITSIWTYSFSPKALEEVWMIQFFAFTWFLCK